MVKLPAGSSAISRASLQLSRQGVDVRVTGGMLVEHSETPSGARLVANGHGADPLTFAWKRKIEDQRANQPLRFRGSLTQLVGLGEDASQLTAEVQIEVIQGLAKDVKLQLPEQFTVNQVSGPIVADWDAQPRELTVTFLEPVEQSTRFVITGEIRLAREGQLQVPIVRLTAAERETGGLAVEVLGAGEIKDRQASGLDEAEASELGQLISARQSPSLLAFRLKAGDGKSSRSLTLAVARYTPQAVLNANVEEAQYRVLFTEDGKMLVQCRLAVRNNQRNFLKLTLPANATLWSASVAGRPIRPGRAPDGALLLPLQKTRSGGDAPPFAIEVAYMDRAPVWTDKGRARLSLVALDMPISRSGLLIHYSPAFKVAAVAGAFRISQDQPPPSAFLKTAQADGPASAKDASQTEGAPQSVADDGTRKLLDRLQTGRRSEPSRNLPIRVSFPRFGPSIYLISELTSENQTPTIELDFQRDKKRGDR